MAQDFAPVVRQLPPALATGDILVEAPPDVPSPASSTLVSRLLPVVLATGGLGVVATAFASGATAPTRSPVWLAFPMMMLISTVVTLMGRARHRGGGVDADRADYLRYLSGLRSTVRKTAAAQHRSLHWSHPDPDTLWTLIGGRRMWERRADDPDFCVVRIGVGPQPLAARLVAPHIPSEGQCDPVTATAIRRFLQTHSTIVAPITIDLRAAGRVTIEGKVATARGVLRAMICQLAVLHPPDQLLIVGVISDRNLAQWDWLKWLPHNAHPSAFDDLGPVRMVYENVAQARRALTGVQRPQVILVADAEEPAEPITRPTILEVAIGGDRATVTITTVGGARVIASPDQMSAIDALICARRLATYRFGAACARDVDSGWPALAGVGAVHRFDPNMLWRGQKSRDRLRVPIGTTVDGSPLELDIKEPAEHGMGPHGLCVGATGSGKSELLRTIALGMMARNSPEVLNLLLIDFKGGATFLDYARVPHVAAVITNLADEGPLVARMRDALAGEINRRQELLRAAGCVSAAAYAHARRAGATLTPLPTLFVIVDEFSELLNQYPEFADVFVAIGRLGRSLGMHLLLASQRLEEGRLRGLEAHLSYRLCLKTLSAGESRTVLGTLDAYQLPNTPGAGYLRTSGGDLMRFAAAFVSGPAPADPLPCAATGAAPSVREFSTRIAGRVTRALEAGGPARRTVLHAIVDRLCGHGPPAHQVWLPPLGPAPALHTLLPDAVSAPTGLTVPIGIVDRPFEQCRTPLLVDLSGAAGNVAIVGAPQSGKSTALRTLITALAAKHDAGQVQFYCLDFGGGALASVQPLPHVGAVAGRADPRLVRRIVAECESVVFSREAIFSEHGIVSISDYRQRRAEPDRQSFADPFGDVFLVIDGWAGVRHEFEALEASITALAARGLSFGVHVVLAASRWAEIRPSLRDQIGTRVELRLGDPADSEFDRKSARHVPLDRPGRGLSRDGLHMRIALPIAETLSRASVAPPIPLLPLLVESDTVTRRADVELGAGVLLGLEERRLHPLAVDFGRDSHLVILGDNQCGKTATLRTLCREIVRTKSTAQARLVIIDFRRSLLGVVESEHLGGYAMSPAALAALLPELLEVLRRRMPPPDASQAQLRSGSWWSGPEVFVVVDDYDLVSTPAANPLAALVEYLPYARDLGLHLVVARRAGGAERALFEPLLAGLRDHGCMTLMMSGRPGGGATFGSGNPGRLPPGRGVLATPAGDEQLVQVLWSPP
ncbi:MAG TPA: type VII secretion protein EccCb [Mycobacterium sp.]|nr:type VII secretion protein EccCb [Mycobacterium sp.]HTX94904.1 type VII secretion protein EccCb [Mycobacterium sp.]